MDITENTITRWGSGPDGEGENLPRTPNWLMKQKSTHSGHEKHHSLSVLTISYPNGMRTIVSVASARHWDGTILTWSNLDNVLHDLCVQNNLPIYCF